LHAASPDVDPPQRSGNWSYAGQPRIPPGDIGGCQGELVWLGYRIAASTVWQILHVAGLDPAPDRSGPTWCQFLTAHAQAVLTVDVLHVDTVFLRRISALIAVEHGSRRTYLTGVTTHPTAVWTAQAAHNLLMDLGDRATTIKFLLLDRDSQFTRAFDAVFAADGIRIHASPDSGWLDQRVRTCGVKLLLSAGGRLLEPHTRVGVGGGAAAAGDR
jgi:hypothetical protein